MYQTKHVPYLKTDVAQLFDRVMEDDISKIHENKANEAIAVMEHFAALPRLHDGNERCENLFAKRINKNIQYG